MKFFVYDITIATVLNLKDGRRSFFRSSKSHLERTGNRAGKCRDYGSSKRRPHTGTHRAHVYKTHTLTSSNNIERKIERRERFWKREREKVATALVYTYTDAVFLHLSSYLHLVLFSFSFFFLSVFLFSSRICRFFLSGRLVLPYHFDGRHFWVVDPPFSARTKFLLSRFGDRILKSTLAQDQFAL